jgi:drug/metabolite transporter (DMT)-like permease
MNIFKWLGVFVIIAGIILIGYGSKKADVESARLV